MYKLAFPKNKLTAISGYMGSGMTLTAVAILTEMSKDKDCPKIVANIHLKNIVYEFLGVEHMENLPYHSNSVALIDMITLAINDKSKELFSTFIKQLGENDNTLVVAGQQLIHYLPPEIIEQVDLWVSPHYNAKGDYVDLTLYPSLIMTPSIHLSKVSRYFGNYDDKEIINVDILKARVE